ncbi:rhodanese-like domain-containing protein [Dyadobacter psychrotolerans]|uniref:Rhodanese-like domain-containing protein n=1 Tax=Dyadobacter psychrotolerans TaxID=2541721 RepID=A0A4R5D4E6_9BACT|nr:rhodanese-like domain-containing protein [Dyadobacter psychrotolerans]TDE08166.1 rhodanese-like domain-containing protein [Dyadobacter psychrotolerans]
MRIFSAIFGNSQTDLKDLVDNGALIVDVRSPQEFASGHIEGSVNMPLDRISSKAAFLKNGGKPVITCCRSGARSEMAAEVLKAGGVEVYNGGAWNKLRKKIQEL